MILSAVCTLCIRETNNTSLQDALDKDTSIFQRHKHIRIPYPIFRTDEEERSLNDTVAC